MLILLLLKIFFARIVDVSLGTFRTILTVKGKLKLPTLIAFFEVLIWYYVAKEALLEYESKILVPISYALGYASGSLIGTYLSKRYINNLYEIKIEKPSIKLRKFLQMKKYKTTKICLSNKDEIIIIYLYKNEYEKLFNELSKLKIKTKFIISEAKLSKTCI